MYRGRWWYGRKLTSTGKVLKIHDHKDRRKQNSGAKKKKNPETNEA